MNNRGSWQIKFISGQLMLTGKTDTEKKVRRFTKAFKDQLQQYLSKVSIVDLRYTNGLSITWKSNENQLKQEEGK